MVEVTNFLERIAQRQSSFVLFGSRVYDIVNSNGLPDSLTAVGSNLEMGLVPSLSFSEFERLDERVEVKGIEAYCRDYIANAIDQELRAEEDVRREKNRVYALKFIMTELLPFLVSKKYSTDELLFKSLNGDGGGQTLIDQAKAEIADKLNQDFGTGDEAEFEDPAEQMRQNVLAKERRGVRVEAIVPAKLSLEDMGLTEDQVQDSVLGQITSNQPVYITNGRVFRLEPQQRFQPGDFKFKLNGKTYRPVFESLDLPRIVSELSERRQVMWRMDALERSKDAFQEIKGKLRQEAVSERQMYELAKLEEYDLDTCGFLMRDGRYFVYSKTPKFATQDGRKKDVFWPYEATRVAIKVGWEDGRAYTTDKAIVIDRREFHPCLSGRTREGGFCSLCNLNERSYSNTAPEMVRKLSDAVQVFKEPLNKRSLDSHKGHSYFGDHLNDILKQGALTREQAIEQGYEVVEVLERKIT
ncbi:MAG: hypothetical protein KKG59_02145 [Nanoarchaeota archaeon]|nr:hypothetical protein [Nanoarchaeota archaeon]